MTDTDYLLDQIREERVKQDNQWGEQHHAPFRSEVTRLRAERQADSWQQINDSRVDDDTLTWDGILLEEVYEALAEDEPQLLVNELIQVAAVAVAMAESVMRLVDETDDKVASTEDDESEAA